jgi:hypothetical protein
MEFDRIRTAAAFLALVAAGAGALIAAPVPMGTGTVLLMVVPSMLVFGLLCLGLGVKHGEHRGRASGR